MNLQAKIEAILFAKGAPVKISNLAKILSTSEEEVKTALKELEGSLSGRGLKLVFKEKEVMLGTSPLLSSLIEGIYKEEMTKDLGKAGLETLSIVLYRGPINRSDVDYIRGVNSQFILRNLTARGLVEKIPNPKDQRGFLYKPTFELLSMLGLGSIEELPEYDKSNKSLDTFFSEAEDSDNEE